MLSHEDLKWIALASTELNSILQQISRYSDLARRHPGEPTYLDLLGERVELGTKSAQAMFDRITTQILARTAAIAGLPPKGSASPFTVLPPPEPIVASKPPASSSAVKAALSAITASHGGSMPSRTGGAFAPAIPEDIKVRNRNGKRELILIVEDEVVVAEMAAEFLISAGYKVVLAHDGFEALRIYGRIGSQIGLVILDFFLPIMDGDAIFDELRAANPNVVVVLSSGFAEQQKISSMLSEGLRGFIPKPYTSAKLLAQVRSILDTPGQTA